MENPFANHSKKWFLEKLIIRPYLQVEEVENHDIFGGVDIVINVSGRFNDDVSALVQSKNVQYYWFPIKVAGVYDTGLNSLYEALKVLYSAEKQDKKVILHCMLGNNRSRTVAEAYHYSRFHEHLEDPYKGYKSHLFYNCENSFLLSVEEIEFFLLNLEHYNNFYELYDAMKNQ